MLFIDDQNQSNMYIIINKTTQESAVFKEKISVSHFINKSVSTICRNEDKKCWETKDFIIYNPQIIRLKSKRGGTNNFSSSKGEF